MKLYEGELLIICHQPAKSGGHRYHGSGDIMTLVCHVILQDHITKGMMNFKGGNP